MLIKSWARGIFALVEYDLYFQYLRCPFQHSLYSSLVGNKSWPVLVFDIGSKIQSKKHPMEYKSQHQDSADDFWWNIFLILDHQVQDPRDRYFVHQAKLLVGKNYIPILGHENLQICFIKILLKWISLK